MTGRLKPNPLIGIRVPTSLRSEKDWYSMQSACARYVILLSFIFLDSAILFFILEIVITSVSFAIPTMISVGQIAVAIALMGRAVTKQGKE